MTATLSAIQRARPLLGTRVAVQAHAASEAEAHNAVDAAFTEIELVHRLMSFHEADSDVSRLNANAHQQPVRVHPYTYEVLRTAAELSEVSLGCFDITVAPHLVVSGFLPAPASAFHPDPESDWRDVELCADDHVRFRRPLWIDLGGIAKGYAVDKAFECLRARGIPQGCVNAGGDLRIYGAHTEYVMLRLSSGSSNGVPIVEIGNGSIASSDAVHKCNGKPGIGPPHIDGRYRKPVKPNRFVSVVAEQCMIADALTKVVLSRGKRCESLLRSYGATAYIHARGHGWQLLGANA